MSNKRFIYNTLNLIIKLFEFTIIGGIVRSPAALGIRNYRKFMLMVLFFIYGFNLIAVPDNPEQDLRVLLAGLESVPLEGIPGAVLPYGPEAFPFLLAETGSGTLPFAVAGRYGQGRFIVISHGAYLNIESDTTEDAKLIRNCINWLPAKKSKTKILLTLGVKADPYKNRFAKIQAINNLSALADFSSGTLLLLNLDAYFNAGLPLAEGEISAFNRYLANGGSVLCGGILWSWRDYQKDDIFPGNQLFLPLGAAFINCYAQKILVTSDAAALQKYQVANAWAAVKKFLNSKNADRGAFPEAQVAQAAFASLADAHLPLAAPWRSGLETLQEQCLGLVQNLDISPAAPLLKSKHARERLAVQLITAGFSLFPGKPAPVLKAAERFPGKIAANLPAVSGTIELTHPQARWNSTGLYAPPGRKIVVKTSAQALTTGIRIRIGSHTEKLYALEEWKRWPEISCEKKLQKETEDITNPFGGLIYIVLSDKPAQIPLRFTFEGALEAPWFVAGQTDPQSWMVAAAKTNIPFLEIEGKNIIITFRKEDVGYIQDPIALLDFWDNLVASGFQFTVSAPPLYKERFVADVQLAAGYMNAGYPIDTHLDGPAAALNLQNLLLYGSWGHFHELGHNLQWQKWIFEGTGEVTCNFFTLYAMQKAVRIPPLKHHMLFDAIDNAQIYLAQGGDFTKWKSDPFLALVMFAQLADTFGWDIFSKSFQRFLDGEVLNDNAKRDAWLIYLSEAVQRNLGPYFKSWAIPISQTALAKVGALPAWQFPLPAIPQAGTDAHGLVFKLSGALKLNDLPADKVYSRTLVRTLGTDPIESNAGTFRFNGKDNYLVLDREAALSGYTSFTIDLNLRTTAKHKQVLIQQRDQSGFNGEYQLALNSNGQLTFMCYGNNRFGAQLNSAKQLNDGLWHRVRLVYDKTGKVSATVDNVPDKSSTGSSVPFRPFYVCIGADTLDKADYFEGELKEISLTLNPDNSQN